MIGYVTLGTNNINCAETFYDKLFSVVGIKQLYKFDDLIGWGQSRETPVLAISIPYDKKAATVGNGVMVALKVESNELVRKLYEKAIELGATDEGEPGFRTKLYFGAYVRDLDGNKLNFHCTN